MELFLRKYIEVTPENESGLRGASLGGYRQKLGRGTRMIGVASTARLQTDQASDRESYKRAQKIKAIA